MALMGNTEEERLAKHYCENFLMRRLPKMVYEKIVPSSGLDDPELRKETEEVMEAFRFDKETGEGQSNHSAFTSLLISISTTFCRDGRSVSQEQRPVANRQARL